MTKFAFGDFEAEIDAMDMDFAEKYENAADALNKGYAKVPKDGKMSEIIKQNAQLVFAFFDAVFGEGAAKKVFGDKVNMRVCNEALLLLAKAYMQDRDESNNFVNTQIKELFPTNRAQRRAANKAAPKS